MLRAAGRFILGFTASAFLTLTLFFVCRSLFLETIQTPNSEPHYEVRYAGLTPEAMLAVAFLFPLVGGLLFAAFFRRTISKHVAIATAVLILPIGFGLAAVFNTVLGDTLWLGID